MLKALRFFVLFFGTVCCLIALAHIAIGPAAIPGGGPVNATMDSEDRFYATLFLGFGAALIWCSGDLRSRGRAFDALLLIFLLGGVARVVSAAQVGWPNPLFTVLGAVELGLPPVLWWWRNKALSATATVGG
jgi:hypothetical protein